MKIEILGPGCTKCRATEANVRQVLAELGIEADVVHVTDLLEIGRRRVMLTPGVMVDGHLRCSGKVPELGEIRAWFATAA